MTLQSFDKSVHPLEILIQKYAYQRTRADVARDMAKISLHLEGRAKSYNELEYKQELKARAKYYEGYLSKYLSGSSKPRIEILLLMSRALGCNLEELVLIFYPDYHALGAGANSNGAKSSKAKIQSQGQSSPTTLRICPPPKASELNLAQESDFQLLKVHDKVEYSKGDSNTLKWRKDFKLKSLKDNLKVLENFDYYKCQRDKPDVDISFDGEPIKIRREKAFHCDDNLVTIIFENPLERDQEVEFSLSYFFSGVSDRQASFHYTWILHSTELMTIEVTPPNLDHHRQARYYVHLNKGCPWGIEKLIESADVFLDAQSSRYKLEIINPGLHTTHGIYWGRKFW
jgi:Helix-turn-helix